MSLFNIKPKFLESDVDLFGSPCCLPWIRKTHHKLMLEKKVDMLGCCGSDINSTVQPPSTAYSPPATPYCSVLRARTNASVINNGTFYTQQTEEGFDITENNFELFNVGAEDITNITFGASNGIGLVITGTTFPATIAAGASTGFLNFVLQTAALPVGTYTTVITFTGTTASCGTVTFTFGFIIEQSCGAAYPETIDINGDPFVPATPPTGYLYIALPITGSVGAVLPVVIDFVNPSLTHDASIQSGSPAVISGALPSGITFANILPLPNDPVVAPGDPFPVGQIGGEFTIAPGTAAGITTVDMIVSYFICTTLVELFIEVQIEIV